MASDDFAGGGDKDWDKFGNGITARRRPAITIGGKSQPDYGDDWADKAFNIKVEAPTGFVKQK